MTFWKGRPPIKNVMVSFSQKKNLPTYNCFCFISTENRSGHTCFLDTAFSSKLICNWNVYNLHNLPMNSEKLIKLSSEYFIVEISKPVYKNIKKLAFQFLHRNSSTFNHLRFDLLTSPSSAYHIFNILSVHH